MWWMRASLTGSLASAYVSGWRGVLTKRSFTDLLRKQRQQSVAAIDFVKHAMPTVYEVTVCDANELSPTVRGLQLRVNDASMAFKAGQWVDMFVPGIIEVAGYSMCSSPKLLKEHGLFELAIKQSPFAPTKWLCHECKVGSVVKVSVGGEFYYDPQLPQEQQKRNVLLVAGGVGINPLVSMLRHMMDVEEERRPGRVLLASSAPILADLIFREQVQEIVNESKNIAVEYFVTRHDESDPLPAPRHTMRYHCNVRIDESQLSTMLKRYFDNDVRSVDSYVCGPTNFIDDVNAALLRLGLTASQIKYEKWW